MTWSQLPLVLSDMTRGQIPSTSFSAALPHPTLELTPTTAPGTQIAPGGLPRGQTSPSSPRLRSFRAAPPSPFLVHIHQSIRAGPGRPAAGSERASRASSISHIKKTVFEPFSSSHRRAPARGVTVCKKPVYALWICEIIAQNLSSNHTKKGPHSSESSLRLLEQSC